MPKGGKGRDMPEQIETVDSVAKEAPVETVAKVENPSMEDSSPKTKTYTEAEHDAIVKSRIDKQNAKHAVEVDAIKQELEQLRAENDQYKAKEATIQARKAAAEEYGVPADKLDGETEAEIKAQARAIAAFQAAQPAYGSYKDSGESKPPAKPTTIPSII